ncbi:hypothetical protein [Burkholderia perseverans]|uniref:hypothetical protein n=1 Tax=Burkholderia perseverans TaxID=2615214 RepID=UPI001FEFEA76|nr:hypothetical protein [Burkholderia perseverans]
MPRKPVSELKGGRGSRQIVWEFIRAHADSFTVFDIEKATRLDLATIRTYVQWLGRGGFVAVTNDTRTSRQRKQYRLVRNVGIEAPRIDKAGKLLAPTGQENMWRTMRIAKTFTAEELAARSTTDQTSVSVASARNYITDLARADYLLVVDPGHPYRLGVGAKQARYRLATSKYTGPRPPMIQRTKSLYDPNLGKIVWQEEPDHDAA